MDRANNIVEFIKSGQFYAFFNYIFFFMNIAEDLSEIFLILIIIITLFK